MSRERDIGAPPLLSPDAASFHAGSRLFSSPSISMPRVAERERTERISIQLADRDATLRGIEQLYTKWGSTSPVGRERDRYQQALLDNDVVILEAGMATGKSTLGMPLALEALLKKYESTKGIATEPTKQLMREIADTLGGAIGTPSVH